MDDGVHRDLGRAPIPGKRPDGQNVRDEPDFEMLSEEIAKLGALEPTPLDWELVQQIAARIIAEQSKDLLAACYLCRAWTEIDGYSGLARGAEVLADLVEHFWTALFPPLRRLPARISALEWLFDALVAFIENSPPAEASAKAASQAEASFTRLDKLLAPKVEGGRLARLSVCRRLLADGLAQNDASLRGKEGDDTKQSTTAKPPVDGPSGSTNRSIDLSSERARRKALIGLASELRAASLADPLPYRLLRAATWGGMVGCPPRNVDGRTQVPPVSPERVHQCRQLLADNAYDAAVNAIEEGIARAPYWLDGQRMVANALTALGYMKARRAVEQDTQNLLTDLPELAELSFSNGEPLAEADTLDWITRLAGGGAPPRAREPGEQAPAGTAAQLTAELENTRRDARRLNDEGRFDDAIARFAAGIASAGTVRAAFVWRTAQARFILSAGHYRLALGQLEHLDIEAQRYRLDDWEPDLAAEVAGAMLECYNKRAGKLPVSPAQSERLYAALSRLARLDPSLALSYADIKLRS